MVTPYLLGIRLAAAAAMLAYVAFKDVKEREVSDIVWFVFIPLGAVLLTYQSLMDFYFPYYDLLAIALSGAVAFGVYKVNLYGGADALALTTFSVILPTYEPNIYFHTISALMVFTNGVFFSLAIPIYFGLRNLSNILKGQKIFSGFEDEPLWKKVLACFLGYRATTSRNFLFSLQRTRNGRKEFDFGLANPEDDFISAHDSWVTPGLPLLLFMAFGFIFLLLVGDILAIILRAILA